MARPSELTRQRIDYQKLPGGGMRAVLTVTFPGGHVERYAANVHPQEVAGLWGDLKKVAHHGLKAIGHAVKHVLTSKVLKLAAKGLTAAGAALPPPVGPAALAAGSTLGVASKLGQAAFHHKNGDKRAADHSILEARLDAHALGGALGVSPESLLADANAKRVALQALMTGAKPPPPPVRTRGARVNVLAAARAGALRSNRPGNVSESDLARAASEGRVFWLA